MMPAVPGFPFASAPEQRRAAVANIRDNSGNGVPGRHRSRPPPTLAVPAVSGAD